MPILFIRCPVVFLSLCLLGAARKLKFTAVSIRSNQLKSVGKNIAISFWHWVWFLVLFFDFFFLLHACNQQNRSNISEKITQTEWSYRNSFKITTNRNKNKEKRERKKKLGEKENAKQTKFYFVPRFYFDIIWFGFRS